ncbi:FCP1 homology domain-containing protein [Heracleum sosnowskyi]|uniref:FCP1 homology domain-containing protein n=1 Tax=Heracleum sosnowskyi TaxID=360622 RepID=A0AAD8HZ79_9APIA|nr:FCP1 homology domain-containing protein [Heracleum sosnowskyi]
MPSLKMKTKSIAGCQRDKNGLHICPTSMISKNSLSHSHISQQEIDLETHIQNKQDVLCNNINPLHDVGEARCNGMPNGGNLQVQEQLSASGDMEANLEMILGSALVPSTSNLGTIFSLNMQSTDEHKEPDFFSFGGSGEELGISPLRADGSDDYGRSSCENQTCNISDFNIADLIFSESPALNNSLYSLNGGGTYQDYQCDERSSCLDDEVMILPFLEDSLETNNAQDKSLCEDSIDDSVDSSLYSAIHQLKTCNQESVNPNQDLDQAECLDTDIFFRTNPWPTSTISKELFKKKSNTLVLDLDETLVHSTLDHCDDADFTFPVSFNMKEHIVYVKKRPHLHAFLGKVAEMFKIVVFTASQSIYAEQLLDILDPDRNVISRRAYRESCIFADGSYTKDLTVLGVDLANIAIIDNSPQVFRLQVNNGIPIKSWFGDPSDSALISLLSFLETLVDAEDVRPLIAKKFGNMA